MVGRPPSSSGAPRKSLITLELRGLHKFIPFLFRRVFLDIFKTRRLGRLATFVFPSPRHFSFAQGCFISSHRQTKHPLRHAESPSFLLLVPWAML